ncbi:hypothetical protein GCM10028792_31330 [Salinisphaera aquimarina]
MRTQTDDSSSALVTNSPDVRVQRPTPPSPAAEADLKVDKSAPLTLRMDESPPESDKTTETPARKTESLREYATGKDNAEQDDSDLPLASTDSTPLNLKVPEEVDPTDAIQDADIVGPSATASDDEKTRDAKVRKAFDLNEPPAPTPKVASYSLFNPEYGLRGFMKQGWVNNTFGVQGGLGFNDGRRIQSDNNDIRDDIAVGMGVILAF